MKIGIYGLGEAGRLIATDLAELHCGSVEVHAFDPADVPTPDGVVRHENPTRVAEHADVLLGITAAFDAKAALQQGIEVLPRNSVYADLATAAPELKIELANIALQQGRKFCDVALMAIVPGNGLRTPALASGDGAELFGDTMCALGMPVTMIGDKAGDAAQRKLLRSVTMKGLASVLIESMQGAAQAGCADWLWKNLCDEISKADAKTLRRLILGTGVHAQRRLHEMEASRDMLVSLGIDPSMTRATVTKLQQVQRSGIPAIPPSHDATE